MRTIRISVAFCFLILIFGLSACRATPEEAVAVQKDTEELTQMIEPKPEEAEAIDLRTKLNVPETFISEVEFPESNISVKADAEVIVPECSGLSLVDVQLGDFTQETVDGLVSVLYAGKTIYEITQGATTKAEIEEQIVNMKYIRTFTEDAEELALIDASIEELEKAYLAAPEESRDEIVVSDGKLKLMDRTDDDSDEVIARYYALTLRTDTDWQESQTLLVCNRVNYVAVKPELIPDNTGATSYILYTDYTQPTFNDNGKLDIPVYDGMALDEQIAEKLKLTPDKAIKLAEDTLEAAGLGDIAVHGIYLIDNEQDGNVDGIVAAADSYAYKVMMERTVNGISCSVLDEASHEEFQRPWAFESIELLINDNGIFNLSWKAPLTIGETYEGDAQLLDYSEIIDQFESYIYTLYVASEPRGLSGITIDIDKVELEYQRMRLKDGDDFDGLLVPVWDFYGYSEEEYTDGNTYSAPYDVILSINAMDGSLFDPCVGY